MFINLFYMVRDTRMCCVKKRIWRMRKEKWDGGLAAKEQEKLPASAVLV